MFPIVFAAIIGRSMKMIARFLAEKGAKLGVRLVPTASTTFIRTNIVPTRL